MFEKILVPLDGSLIATCVLPHVAAMARLTNQTVTLLRIMDSRDSGMTVNPVDWQLQKSEAQHYLQETGKKIQESITGTPESVLLEGRPADRIIEYANQNEVDLVVLSSHGQGGLHSWNVSSNTQKVLYRVGTSVLLVRAYQANAPLPQEAIKPIRYRRILVPLDGSQRAEHVLASATALAEGHDAELILVHVVTQPTMMQRMPLTAEDATLAEQIFERNQIHANKYFEQLRGRLQPKPQTHVLTNHNVPAVLHNFVNQNEIDLVLLSAHGHSGEGRWPFGSIVSSFVNFGMTPLLIMQDMPGQVIEPTYVERITKATQGQAPRSTGGENVPDSERLLGKVEMGR
jgi:nucleotide-binding universal stress UspA family protein